MFGIWVLSTKTVKSRSTRELPFSSYTTICALWTVGTVDGYNVCWRKRNKNKYFLILRYLRKILFVWTKKNCARKNCTYWDRIFFFFLIECWKYYNHSLETNMPNLRPTCCIQEQIRPISKGSPRWPSMGPPGRPS